MNRSEQTEEWRREHDRRRKAAQRARLNPPETNLPDSSWLEDAACFAFGTDTAVFFPPSSHSGKARRGAYDEARTICSVCPVRTPCLDDALRWEAQRGVQRVGFVGGMSPEERGREHARRR